MMNTTKAPHPIKRFYSTISKRHSFPARQSSPLIISTATSPLRPRRHVCITTTTTEIIDPPIQDDTVTAFWDYQFLFASQRNEALESIVLRVVDGAIPSDFPSGTYYLTGPGIFSDDYGSTVHPLDGHGYLRAFSLDGSTGEVRFSARYVETEAQKEERDGETGRWRFTHRGPFSVLRGGKKVGNTKVMKNVANTSVVEWGGRLLCLWEGGDPYEVEAETLDTVGRFEVWMKSGGHLEEEEEEKKGGGGGGGIWDFAARMLRPILFGVFKMAPKRLLSHYKIDPKRNRLLLVSCNAEDMLLPRSIFTFHEFDLNFSLIQKQDFVIPDHIMIHDWAFTDSHYILFGNRIKLDVPGSMLALFGLSPMISALTVNPSKTTSPIYVLPRDPMNTINGHRDWNVPIEAPEQMWVLHTANAFEQIDERGNLKVQIHAVACSYQWFNFHKMFGYNWRSGKLDPSFMNEGEEGEKELLPHLVKVSINFGVDGIFHKCSVDTLEHWRRASDFPTINPSISGSKNNFIYVATSSGSNLSLPHFPFNSVAKVDINGRSISLWSARNRGFIGESIFVPKGDKEDDGYILTIEMLMIDAYPQPNEKQLKIGADSESDFTHMIHEKNVEVSED
ncbi:hypothetical protein Sjap_023922 [Stephania japonica]|uniref:Carotenoid cleavage dioxygenase 7 n=1 Tax=Stephania japonica TaxID=461633 RepID=A0AAP0ECJ0_9MAGN